MSTNAAAPAAKRVQNSMRRRGRRAHVRAARSEVDAEHGAVNALHLPMAVIVGAVPGAITCAIEQKRKASE